MNVGEIQLDCGENWWEGRNRELCDARQEGSGGVYTLVLQPPWRSD